jgi:hypothetical protein
VWYSAIKGSVVLSGRSIVVLSDKGQCGTQGQLCQELNPGCPDHRELVCRAVSLHAEAEREREREVVGGPIFLRAVKWKEARSNQTL